MAVPFALALLGLNTANARLVIHLDQPTVRVSPDLYGIFFEEINNAGDGGLYAEMVQNGHFAFSDPKAHWSAHESTLEVKGTPPSLIVSAPIGGGVSNDGYWGINVVRDQEYKVDVRGEGGKVSVNIEANDGTKLANREIDLSNSATAQHFSLRSIASNSNARLVVRSMDGHPFVLRSVSMFPKSTFNNRVNGLREDLAAMLFNLAPAFMRFPGGCWVEGDKCATSYRWKTTIGPLDKRRSLPNLWNYVSGNGLGYHEYLQLCEDIGAAPLFVINCGMSHKEVVPMDKMDEYVQDALDAIEYANGPATSPWGKLRAQSGHPQPFGLKYMEIGNENGGPAYAERYPLFVKAIKAKHPEIKLVTNVWGGVPESAPVEIIDEHYYSTPDFFIQNADRYDSYDRKGPKVYVGEYAVTQGCGNGNLLGAIGEAAFMTGMERNSDIVVMSSYAPLFAHVKGKVWNPDLIYFDNETACGTPSYYVQKMFSRNRADQVLKTDLEIRETRKGEFAPGGIGIGTWGTQAEFKDIEIIKNGETVYKSADGKGLKIESGKWESVNGAIRQTSLEDGTRAWIGEPDLIDYTLKLKARKVSGAEGFLITVGRTDEKNYMWWNIGGWGNSQNAIERAVNGNKTLIGKQMKGSVQSGRWYDIEVEYGRDKIVCKLDGKVMYSEDFPVQKPVYVVAGKTDSGDVIVKVVNVSDHAQTLDLAFEGGAVGGRTCNIQSLTSERPEDENSLERPQKVYPKSSRKTLVGGKLDQTLPAHSLTIFRITGGR